MKKSNTSIILRKIENQHVLSQDWFLISQEHQELILMDIPPI